MDKRTNRSYLYHHGIKGQKWGVRRYQNEDGTLTKEGRARLCDEYEFSGEKHFQDLRKKKFDADLKSKGLDKNVIAKGTEIRRVANAGETLDNRRKYVSVTDWDRALYDEMFDEIGLDTTKKYGEYTYTAKKDLKIAGADEVIDYICKEYGGTKLKNLYKTQMEFNGLEDNEYYDAVNETVTKSLHIIMEAKMADVEKHFKEKGYDGFVDIEDFGVFAQYPVILTTPINSLEFKKYDDWTLD